MKNLKIEIQSKTAIIKIILDNKKRELGQQKPFHKWRHENINFTNTNMQQLKKSPKIKKAGTLKRFYFLKPIWNFEKGKYI